MKKSSNYIFETNHAENTTPLKITEKIKRKATIMFLS